jgi:hypothetical protein
MKYNYITLLTLFLISKDILAKPILDDGNHKIELAINLKEESNSQISDPGCPKPRTQKDLEIVANDKKLTLDDKI